VRKALFLTRNFPPYVTSGASRAWKFASNLSAIGWEPVVVAPPAIAGMAADVKSGANPVIEIYRTAPDIDASGLDVSDRNDLLHGHAVPALNQSLKAKISGLFRDLSDGALWEKSAAATVERLLGENPEIDLLYAQGPPLEPLMLALEVARKHPLAVMLDITEPLDPAMPQPGTSSSSVAAEAEEHILLSGVPLLTPTRVLKEYFLKKYHGRLDFGKVTIVPSAFDASHPAFRKQGSRTSGTVLRVALLLEAMPRADLRSLIAGLDSWIRADGIMTGGLELSLFGDGVPELLRRVTRKPIEKLFTIDETGGIDSELEQCRNADFFCVVQGNPIHSTSIIPERLFDALGMGLPLCAIAPEGATSRLVLEAGGLYAPSGDAGAIMELFRSMATAWSLRSLYGAPEAFRQKHGIAVAMRELQGAIASQPLI
jgi:hypothetical protein